MDFFQHRYYRTTKILMTIIGQWPYQSGHSSRGSFVAVIFLTTSQAIPLFMAVYKYYDDRDIFLDSLLASLYGLWCVAKLCTFRWRSGQMLNMLNRIRADWVAWSGHREINVLHEYAEQGRKFTIMYTVAVSSIVVLYMVQPIVANIIDAELRNGSKPRKFPIPGYYFNLDAQRYYSYIIIHTYVCITTIMIISMTYDLLLIIYVQHGCGIFAAVGQKLERIGKTETSVKTVATTCELKRKNKTSEHMIFLCITRHNEAIEYAELIEETYTWTFFLTVVSRIVLVSISGLQIIAKINEPQESARFIAFFLGMTIYVYMESSVAQVLMDHSLSIRYSIQNSQWYTLSLNAQKLLLLMTVRCNMPCRLTAGKMLNMSVESFAVYLKTSMSFLTVLRTI